MADGAPKGFRIRPEAIDPGNVANFGFDRADQILGRSLVRGFGGDPEFDFAPVGVGGDGGIGPIKEVGDLFSKRRFRDAPEAEGAADNHFGGPALGLEVGDGGVLPHAFHFAGDAGESHDHNVGLGRPDDAGSSADGVGEDGRALGDQGLFAVAVGEGAAPLGEFGLDVGPDGGLFDQGDVEGLSDRRCGQVVGGRAESTGADDQVGAAGSLFEGGLEPIGVVADGALVVVGDAEVGELLGEVLGVSVEDVTEEEFGADADDFGDFHGFVSEFGFG